MLHFLFTLFFLLIQDAIYQEKSIFNLYFLDMVFHHRFLIILFLTFTAYKIVQMQYYSKYLFLVGSFFVALSSAYGLYNDFNKLILIVLFIYILVTYYFYYFLSDELDQAYYRPNFSNKNLYDPMLLKIVVSLKSDDNHLISGHLTNWSSDGCFVKLHEIWKGPTRVDLQVNFQDYKFEQKGIVCAIANGGQGVGIRFIEESNRATSWDNFLKIITDMGFEVEYLK
jgi:hypothetical protein